MKLSYIELKKGERHPLCFSLSATEAIVDEFGSLEKMTDALTGGDTLTQIKAIDKTLAILLDAGQKYCAEMGIETPPALKCRPADLIDVTDPTAITAIFDTINNDTKREVEAKNAEPTL